MPTHDELEQLSRLVSGELPATEAAALQRELASRPELAEAEQQLRVMLTTAATLPVDLPADEQGRLVARVLASQHTSRRWPWRLGLAAAAALAAGVWFSLDARRPDARVLVAHGAVTLNGQSVSGEAAVPDGAQVETGADSTATLTVPGAELVLGPNTRLAAHRRDPLLLEAGVLYVSCSQPAQLLAGATRVEADGRLFVVAEPLEQLDRVTARLNLQSPLEEAHVRSLLLSIAVPVATVGAITAAAVTVYSGRATASPYDAPKVELQAGQRWQSTPAAPTSPAVAEKDHRLAAAEAEVAALKLERAALRQRIEELTHAGTAANRKPAPLPPIRGSVVDAKGQPVSHATVVLLSDERLSEVASTDGEGRFVLDDVSGRGQLYAHKDGQSSLLPSVEPGTNVSMKLSEPGKIQARVTLAGAPATGSFKVWTAPGRLAARLPGLFGGMQSFSADRFELVRPSGDVQVHVVSDGAPTVAGHALVRVLPGGETPVTIELQPAEGGVRGQVYDAVSSKPVRDYQVMLLLADDSLEAGYPPGQAEFHFSGRSAGDRIVLITADGYQPLRVPVTLEADQTLDVGRVLLTPR